MRVLLLAHAFPPYNASGSVRAAKLAEHLLAAGHDVRVLTGHPHPYPMTLATSFPKDRIISAAWWRIEAPLDALRRRFAGQSLRSDEPASARGRSLATRAVVAYRSLLSFPDAQIGWIARAKAAGLRLTTEWRPDLIYSTALPFSSHAVADSLSRASGVPWVGEFRDLFSGNPYTEVWPLRAKLDIAIEKRIMRSASAVISVSEPLTEYLAKLHGKSSQTIMNGYDPADFERAPDRTSDFDRTRITILYTGIIYPGRRDPAVLFEALKLLGDDRHRFEVRFHGPSLDAVAVQASGAGVGDVVRTLPPVPHLDALGLQKAADLLLLLLWDSPLERGVVTGKLFEYVGAGRPILSLGCLDGAAADIIRDRRLGLASNTPREVAGFLKELAVCKANGGSTKLSQAADSSKGLSRREQFIVLENYLAERGLLEKPAAPAEVERSQ